MAIKKAEELRKLQKSYISENLENEYIKIEEALNKAIKGNNTYILYTAKCYSYYDQIIRYLDSLGYTCEKPYDDQREGHYIKIKW